MKKLVVLAGLAAAAYGAFKLLGGKREEDSNIYGNEGYTPQPSV